MYTKTLLTVSRPSGLIPHMTTTESEIQSVYVRLYTVFSVRPSIDLVAEVTQYPYEITATYLLDMALNGTLEPSTIDPTLYSDAVENVYIKRFIECCDLQQCEPNNSVIRKEFPKLGPAMRRALIAYMNRNYTPLSKTHKRILHVVKTYVPPPYIKDGNVKPSNEQISQRTGLSVDAIKPLLETLTSKGLL